MGSIKHSSLVETERVIGVMKGEEVWKRSHDEMFLLEPKIDDSASEGAGRDSRKGGESLMEEKKKHCVPQDMTELKAW